MYQSERQRNGHCLSGEREMKYCIAVDGGGTKTESVLFDETGHILLRHLGNAGTATDLGVEEARRRLLACLDEVFSHAPGRLSSLYGGVAGVLPNGDIYSQAVRARYAVDAIRFDDDGNNLISGTLGHSDGCGMVCGTGSSLFARVEGQPLRHIGGKGYLIDTGGSGFELGREALCMALRSVDGRCGSTVLLELLEKRLGQPVSDRIIPVVHHRGRAYISSFAPAVFEGRKLGDRICCEIFERQSALLADLTYAAERYFEDRFPVVMGGGIVAHFPEYVEAIKEKASPRADMILQEAPPVYGAAVEAMWDAGIIVTESVKASFLADYKLWEQGLAES